MARLYVLAAALNVWVLVLILAAAFAVQIIAGELPCPLCVVQRIALMLCALGPLYILLQARDGALYAQYCPDEPAWICRPQELPATDLTYAFEPG